jgi:hypothetical protein
MVQFKCIISGNIISFEHEVDILTTRDNPAYQEVKEETKEEEKTVAKKTTKKTTTEE